MSGAGGPDGPGADREDARPGDGAPPPWDPQESLPSLPLEEWRDTKTTLHLFCQVVGKVRMALMPRLNHWWHVPLYVSTRGLTTRTIPLGREALAIELDLREQVLEVAHSSGERVGTSLVGLSVAGFHESLMEALDGLGIEVDILARPFDQPFDTPFADDEEHDAWDPLAVEKWWRILLWSSGVFQEFAGRFYGKQTPVHMFWHSFDLALTRFGGRRAPAMPEADPVSRDAYSHEVVSFGLWAGDDNVPFPAYYSYTHPEPDGLAGRPLSPDAASWQDTGRGTMALLAYEDVRAADDPESALLDFLESAYRAGAELAGWDVEDLRTPWS